MIFTETLNKNKVPHNKPLQTIKNSLSKCSISERMCSVFDYLCCLRKYQHLLKHSFAIRKLSRTNYWYIEMFFEHFYIKNYKWKKHRQT